MQIVAAMIAVVVWAGLASAALVWRWRTREDLHQRRAAWASRMGWTYQREVVGEDVLFAIVGATSEGTPWTLTARRRPRGLGVGHETRWLAVVPREPEATVALGPPLPVPLAAYLGPEVAEIADLRRVDVGPEELRARFEVIATDADVAEQLVSGPTASALLDWSEGSGDARDTPIVLYGKPGLEVRLPRVVHEPFELARIVELGLMLHTTVLPG